MSLKVITDDKGVKVYRQDKTSQSGVPYTQYSLGVSSKKADGTYVNGFIDCSFKKGVEVANKSTIKINNAFYTVSEYQNKKYTKLMITDFDVLDGAVPTQATETSSFMDIPMSVDDAGLPFN